MSSRVAMNSALYSSYRPVEENLLGYVAKIVQQRRFDHAGGVWRELPRKRLRLRRLAYLMVTASIGYWAFWGHHAIPVAVVLSPAVTKEVPIYLDAAAVVQANQTVAVHTQIDGQISEIIFREGQDVKAGDMLAKLDPRSYQIQYDEALVNKVQDEAMLAQAKNELAKAKGSAHKRTDPKEVSKLLEEKRTQVRQFEATVQSDQVAIDSLQTQLNRSVIVSPIDGRTGIRQVDAGNMVHPNDATGLVVITQVEPVSVLFTLPEKTLRPISDRLAKGEKITVLAMDGDNKNVLDEGVLEMVDNQVDSIGGTIHLKASFPNHKRLLWPGATIHIRLLASSLKDAVVVPIKAIHTLDPAADDTKSGQKSWVYVYSASSRTIEMRTVKITMLQDGDAVIQEGIHAGEKVVTDSISPVADGSAVIPKDNLVSVP